jgi:peptidoglycan-associated lipoprotein
METIMRKMLTSAVLGGMVFLLAGCPNPPVAPEKAPVDERSVTPPAATGDTNTNPVASPGVDSSGLADVKKGVLAKRSIYFEFDKYDIQEQYKPLVDAHARYLVAHPDRKMLIQGNCDERGSREYNLALGQKRADAVKRALILLGAKETQIESVSLGEEKPRALGHDEASWAENRRGDVLYTGEY